MKANFQPGLVSIITPAYNAEKFIEGTLSSVLSQTNESWEMIVVDDCSRDSTAEIVRAYSTRDSRIRLVKNTRSLGPAGARNVALEEAKGQFVAFLDSDDQWLPNKLEIQRGAMLKYKWALSFTAYRRMSEDARDLGRLISVPERVTYSGLLKHNVIGCLTAMIDRNQTGVVRMNTSGYDDFILWLDVMKRGFDGHGINEDLARYRRVKGSISYNWFRAAGWVWNIYRNIEGLSLLHSIWYFSNYCVRVSTKHLAF